MRKILALTLLFMSVSANADDWSDRDKYLMTSLIVMQVIDIKQTDKALRDGGRELNPIYGAHPEMLTVAATKAAVVGLTFVLADGYASDRATILIAQNVVQFLVIRHNYFYVQFGF